jgi:magnesium transporter
MGPLALTGQFPGSDLHRKNRPGQHGQQGASKDRLPAAIIVPLNLVTGLFGMMVEVPWRDVDNINLGFLKFICVICLTIARKMKWL